MKTTFNIGFRKLVYLAFLLLIIGCSKDEDVIEGPGPGDGELQETAGISVNDLESYLGDIGLKINTRPIAKKGYTPATVTLETDAVHGNYDQELTVDPFTHVAQLSIAIEDLSEDAENELRNGIPLSIIVRDSNNQELISESFSIVNFLENGTSIIPNTSDLQFLAEEISFKNNMPHFLQTVDANGNYGTNAVEKPSSAGSSGVELKEDFSSYSSSWTNHQYYFHKINGQENVYAISSMHSSRYLTIGNNSRVLRQSSAFSYPTVDPNALEADYIFRIQKESNGLYTIRGMANNMPLRRFNNSGDISWHTNNSGTIQYFRIIALNLFWNAQQVETTDYLSPLFPEVDSNFGFNSTLVNCTQGGLSQVVGINEVETVSSTVGWEESLSISSREDLEVSVTVGVEAEAKFFGGSATASGETTTSYGFSQEVTESQSQFEEETVEETVEFTFERTVTVPPLSASLVYDAYQSYSNVRIPFVKQLIITANQIDPANANNVLGPLTGADLVTQLRMNNFNGLITEVGSNFVRVTLRGTSILDNIIETQSVFTPADFNCN
ncbi:hypothetical protein [uncultured Psychroserpens sp.]|uniref:hypothetical protein n=1 Tax=uncultured Psychroserpens sp. TaxID=255436 RepID=UPI00262AF642|nr:hypothetical protein [uncultured Psychroserpens sp.]